MRNTAPQWKCSSTNPPTSGPKAAPPPPTVDQRPSAKFLCFSSVKALRMPDKVAGISIAAPKPKTAREAIKA